MPWLASTEERDAGRAAEPLVGRILCRRQPVGDNAGGVDEPEAVLAGPVGVGVGDRHVRRPLHAEAVPAVVLGRLGRRQTVEGQVRPAIAVDRVRPDGRLDHLPAERRAGVQVQQAGGGVVVEGLVRGLHVGDVRGRVVGRGAARLGQRVLRPVHESRVDEHPVYGRRHRHGVGRAIDERERTVGQHVAAAEQRLGRRRIAVCPEGDRVAGRPVGRRSETAPPHAAPLEQHAVARHQGGGVHFGRGRPRLVDRRAGVGVAADGADVVRGAAQQLPPLHRLDEGGGDGTGAA